ncbi:lipase [Haloferula helveola]|uniref:Lipase n=1 Tax=Haloferula helveola TaxID=490095 RepID=A0ABN6H2E3_9BACT|nr:lipase [Haloferula helveola]
MLRLIAFLALAVSAIAAPDPDPARFAKEIDAFDAQDAKSPPKKGGIVFAGSSSIRMLKLPKVFPGIEALNRGFGGAHISDMNHYLDRVLLRYEPSTVVFYCGTNDVWAKKPPEQVEEDFNELRERLFKRSPKAELIILAIRPSPARKSILEIERTMNGRFAKIADADPRITYVPGTADRFIEEDETFDRSLFAKDGLHMSDKGYEIWKELITPLLPEAK